MKKRIKAFLWILASILIISGIALSIYLNPGLVQNTSASFAQYIEAPIFGWYSCEASGVTITSPFNTVPQSGLTFQCPKNTPSCKILLEYPATDFFSTARRFTYNICKTDGSSCQGQKSVTTSEGLSFSGRTGKVLTLTETLQQDQKIFVQYQYKCGVLDNWCGSTGPAYYAMQYDPYTVWRTDTLNGGKYKPYTTTGCVISLNDYNKVLSAITGLSDKLGLKVDVSGTEIKIGETFNYISGFITRPGFVTETFQGQIAYCMSDSTGSHIFKVEKIETNGYAYNVVNTNYNTNIGTVQCCNGESTPDWYCNNHARVAKTAPAECSITSPCPYTTWNRDTSQAKTLTHQNCVSGKCVWETKTVECTLDSDCPSIKPICAGWQCKISDIPTPCTGNCQNDSAPVPDCLEQCKSYSIFNPMRYICPTQCKVASLFDKVKIAASILFGFLSFILSYYLLSSFRVFKKKSAMNVISSLIIGILLGVLVFFLLWIAIGIFLVLILIKFILSFVPKPKRK